MKLDLSKEWFENNIISNDNNPIYNPINYKLLDVDIELSEEKFTTLLVEEKRRYLMSLTKEELVDALMNMMFLYLPEDTDEGD